MDSNVTYKNLETNSSHSYRSTPLLSQPKWPISSCLSFSLKNDDNYYENVTNIIFNVRCDCNSNYVIQQFNLTIDTHLKPKDDLKLLVKSHSGSNKRTPSFFSNIGIKFVVGKRLPTTENFIHIS